MDDAAAEGGTLVGVKLVTRQLATSYPTDGVNEVSTIEIFEPVLIWVVSVGPTMEVGSGRVLDPVLITSVLEQRSAHVI